MSGLADVTIAADAQRTYDSATGVLRRQQGVPARRGRPLVEQAKLQKEAEKLRGRIAGIEKKLGNAGFAQKAPPAVIEKERQNLVALQAQLTGVEQSLNELGVREPG